MKTLVTRPPRRGGSRDEADLGSRILDVKRHSPAFPDDHPRVAADR
jgi:hypothetical protein